MTPDDLAKMTTPNVDRPWERDGTIMLPVAGRDVRLLVLCDLDTDAATIGMADALQNLLAVSAERWDEIAALLLEDAQAACINDDLGFPRVEGEDTTTTNRRSIGLNLDGSAPEGWATPDWIAGVEVMTDPEEGDVAAISFSVEWEEEHGFYLQLEDGQFTTFLP